METNKIKRESQAHIMENRFILNKNEISHVKRLVETCLDSYRSFDDYQFLKNLPLMAHKLPTRVSTFLNEFKYNPNKEGYCVVSTGLLDSERLGATPSHWEHETNNDTCQTEVMAMCLCASILGDIFGWLTQQDGRVVHDIVPIETHKSEQLGSGSNEELTWHTEDAFHELRGDYLIMMCSHKPENSSKARKQVLTNDEGLKYAYDTMLNRDAAPEKIAILFGNKKDPCLRIDPYFMDEPEDPKAREAYAAIVELVTESLVEVSLNPGEILIVDNYEVVHGRRAFQAKFDGTDRWYKRLNVIRDIRRCNEVLEAKQSRIVY
jgi:hypothetical protein